jgi:hypothetical protein
MMAGLTAGGFGSAGAGAGAAAGVFEGGATWALGVACAEGGIGLMFGSANGGAKSGRGEQ